MENFKLNALEMAKINGGFDEPININPDGTCSKGPCGCGKYESAQASYDKTMTTSDKAWGA
jgi:hypothetical protein